MRVQNFVQTLQEVMGTDFFTGVPDSQLKALCNYLMRHNKEDCRHVIAANEGNAVAIAAGYHLATGKVPVVYMQNSGEGNAINPLASLLNEKVYAIPAVFVIGWRGEPGVHDEPQHVFQGEITLDLLDVMGVAKVVLEKETTQEMLKEELETFKELLEVGKSVAIVVKKGALIYEESVSFTNNNKMKREEVIEHIVKVSGEDPIISTTGKASRELFEIREHMGENHEKDFLTVGSMGHSSSIALGVALNKPDETVWCIDGDGAVIMHMGSMAVIGKEKPKNLIHIVINNEAHESVGGFPTAANEIDLVSVAKACGYTYAVSVDTFDKLDKELEKIKSMECLCFLEVKAAIGARDDLGRPTTKAIDNKLHFMDFLSRKE